MFLNSCHPPGLVKTPLICSLYMYLDKKHPYEILFIYLFIFFALVQQVTVPQGYL
jgi:hypothetical protein